MNNLNTKILPIVPIEENTIFFMKDKEGNEVLKLCEYGDIFIKGRLAENDKEVVDALKEFLKSQGFLK